MSEQAQSSGSRSGDRRERGQSDRARRPRPATSRSNRPANPRAARAPRPRAADGGVQSSVGEHWWTARWLAALEQLGWRLQRGSAHARTGNVLRIDVQPGQVTAAVKGSQPKPYRVIIRIEPLTDAEWERVTDALAAQALFAARLLAGEMPPTIEDAFAQAGVTLFPTSAKDLHASCTCPDWNSPCKHVAAVHYMLGAEFDRDPFLLFWLRGRSRQQIIEALRAKRTAATPAPTASEASPATAPEEVSAPTLPPLEACLDTFWQPGPSLIGEQAAVQLPEVPESVLRRLGPPPFWRGEYDVMVVLTDAYRTISREAYALAHPEKPVERPAITPIAAVRPAQPADRSGVPPPSRSEETPPERAGRRPGGGRRGGPERPAAATTTDQPATRKRPSRRRWPPRPRRTEPPGPAAASGGA